MAKLGEMAGEGKGFPKRLLRSVVAKRFLKVEGGRVALDEKRIEEDARFDGKWVLRTTSRLPPAEVARHYKGLWRVQRAFRTLKSPLMSRAVERLLEKTDVGLSGEEALAKLMRVTV